MLGAHAPLPMRLQPGNLDNVSAEQYLRACADLASMQRALPFAVLHFAADFSTNTASVDWASCRDSSSSASIPWLTSSVLSSTLRLGFAPTWTDDLGDRHLLTVTRYSVSFTGGSGQAVPNCTLGANGQTLDITWDGSAGSLAFGVLVQLFTDEAVDPRVWGADDEKRNCTTESASIPLVAEMAEQIQLARGSSYNNAGAYVAAETLSLARWMAWLRRQTEASLVQRDPSHAAESLGYWTRILGMDPSLPDWDLRRKMGSKWIRSMRGPGSIITQAGIDAALAEDLGSAYVQTHHPADSVTLGEWYPVFPEWWSAGFTIPMDTRWDANTGHWSEDLGDALRGPWLSYRLHSTVEVYRPPGTPQATWEARVAGVDEVMETLLPAWVTWQHCTDYTTGFLIGYGRIGETGIV